MNQNKHLDLGRSFVLVSLLAALAGCATARGGAGARSNSEPQSGDPRATAAAALEQFEAEKLAAAPLRARAVARLDASAADVWAYVSDHDNLVEYGAGTGLTDAKIDNTAAESEGGVGCKRECFVKDGGRFLEEVVYFRAPYIFAYSAVENNWGMVDHLAVVIVKPLDDGTAELEWRVHFDTADPKMEATHAACARCGRVRLRV